MNHLSHNKEFFKNNKQHIYQNYNFKSLKESKKRNWDVISCYHFESKNAVNMGLTSKINDDYIPQPDVLYMFMRLSLIHI